MVHFIAVLWCILGVRKQYMHTCIPHNWNPVAWLLLSSPWHLQVLSLHRHVFTLCWFRTSSAWTAWISRCKRSCEERLAYLVFHLFSVAIQECYSLSTMCWSKSIKPRQSPSEGLKGRSLDKNVSSQHNRKSNYTALAIKRWAGCQAANGSVSLTSGSFLKYTLLTIAFSLSLSLSFQWCKRRRTGNRGVT